MSYGQDAGPAETLASLDAQTLRPSAIQIWHNGPTFPPRAIPGTRQHWSGVGVGYGALSVETPSGGEMLSRGGRASSTPSTASVL